MEERERMEREEGQERRAGKGWEKEARMEWTGVLEDGGNQEREESMRQDGTPRVTVKRETESGTNG